MLGFYRKYKHIPDAVKASMWFIICSILQKAIQFITVPLFTRLLTTEEYGQFTLYQSWLSLFSIFATLNLSAGVFNNGMIKYPDDRDAYVSSMQGLSVVSTVVVFLVYLAVCPLVGQFIGLTNFVMFIMFVQILFTPPLLFWSTRQRFEYKYKLLVIITLAISVLTPLVGWLMVVTSRDRGLARIISCAFVSILFGLIFMIYNGVKGKVFYHKKYWRFALSFNLPLIPHYLSAIVLGQADRIMIEWYYGSSQVAIYGLAYSLSLVMNIVTSSVNSSFVPWTYQQCRKENYKQIGQAADIMIILVGFVSLLPALLAPELMAILGPAEYAEGAYLVAPISMSVFFTFLYGLFGNIEFYFEKSKFVMIASVSGAVLNIVLNAICIPLFGYQAAAYTTLVCYIAFCFAHYVFMKKTCKEQGITEPIYNIKKIILLGLFLLIVAHGMMLTYEYVILRIVIVAAIGFICYKNRAKFIQEFRALKNKN